MSLLISNACFSSLAYYSPSFKGNEKQLQGHGAHATDCAARCTRCIAHCMNGSILRIAVDPFLTGEWLSK